jgi:hypothetical protein
MKQVVVAACLLLTATPFSSAATVDGSTPPAAAKFLDLFDRLRAAHEKAVEGKFQLVAFQLSESEINEYLAYSLKTTPRPGLTSVTVKVSGNDYVSTKANIDFDAIEKWNPGAIPTLLHPVLKGKKAISIDFRIHADNSLMTFSVEKAHYEDTPLPGIFVEKMIQIMAARQPEHYDTSRPIPIPFSLRKVWTTEHTVQGHN